MIFRQLYDAESSTYTYLIGDEAARDAVLIDPVLEQAERDLELLSELGLRLTYAMDTHVHADHITASGVLRERTGCLTVASRKGPSCADMQVSDGEELRVGTLSFRVLATPGHTDDSVSYLLSDRVFTGDALLIRANGRTDFQNGDASQLYDSITRVLFALPDETFIYPAHDYKGRTVTSVWEEKRFNPRIAGKSREAFIQIMENLNLPKPKKLDLAVPANRACGKNDDRASGPIQDFDGKRVAYHDIPASMLGRLSPEVRRIDVREPEEYEGPLGHLPEAQLVPLATLEATAQSWPREQGLLLICRSGSRSARAARILSRLGFKRLYNLDGGMLAIRSESAPAAASPQSV